MRPRIGITVSTTFIPTLRGDDHQANVNHATYARSVLNAGGLPILLPNLPDPSLAAELLAPLDGLLLSGGGDVDPAVWGEARHPSVSAVDPMRDALEMALLREAVRRDLPVLGICRGVQVMAVTYGGDLWQDLPSQYPGCLPHRQSTLRSEGSHPVELAADSRLTAILAPQAPAGKICLHVNSFHHQAPRKCGTIWTAVALSSDGVVEALVADAARFAMGVQWHPEEMAETDAAQARLFAAFVQAAQR